MIYRGLNTSDNTVSLQRTYEVTDHLGNVRAVVGLSDNPQPCKTYSLLNATDYYPFGWPMPGRTLSSGQDYRFAYQGQEKDPKTGEEAFELRSWDGRLGRWTSIDPYKVHASPYLGMGNNPVSLIDPDGGFPTRAAARAFRKDNGLSANIFQSPDGAWFLETGSGQQYAFGTGTAGMSGRHSFAYVPSSSPDAGLTFNHFFNDGKFLLGKGREMAYQKFDNFTQVGTTIIFPTINQIYVSMKEGVHEGKAYNSNNELKWAVPYRFKNGKFVKNGLHSPDLLDGKDAHIATIDVILSPLPVKKYDVFIKDRVFKVVLTYPLKKGTVTIWNFYDAKTLQNKN